MDIPGSWLNSEARGTETSEAFGVRVPGLIIRCSECRLYNRVVPNTGVPPSFEVVPYPTEEEERSFKDRRNEVAPFGCPDCDPPRSVTVSGFHEARKIVNHSCCGIDWDVSIVYKRLHWSCSYRDGSFRGYALTKCPKCGHDKAYYDDSAGKTRLSKCKNCGSQTQDYIY